MKTFLKVNVASLTASFCDYLVTILLVKFLSADPLMAGVTGTVVGGFVNFLIGRHWVFKVRDHSMGLQGRRYLITWTGNLFLNTAGLYVLIKLFKIQYIIAKVTVSIIVAFTYNYHIQKRYVFKNKG
ncbi:GtrA family protein [Ferruginibacter paludis]|uniref:GtrA family protein n=1 Tax=Ferruginibacter paludis TaxID=1310417 RepID=UPI0025B53123|nr:GtrA family protein [Ferruginibacter paludis]MDN3659098.1 GtrA family protein [Ferruginibacter paludis]